MAKNEHENVNDFFFDGYYKEIWRLLNPSSLTDSENTFIIDHFHLSEESKVLDLMCGYGRHAIELAKNGVQVTAVDNLKEYIDEIKEAKLKESLPIRLILSDVLDYCDPAEFDLVISMGSNISFFNQGELNALFAHVNKSLKPGGYFLINTWMLSEIATRHFKDTSSFLLKDIKYTSTSKFLNSPHRIESITSIKRKGNLSETKKAVDYLYTFFEIEYFLRNNGFVMINVYGALPRKFTLGDDTAYIIAKKN
jgi:cyclopropane fatty-acyl-phospholipid synthase-like methyltransferase